MRAFRFRTLLTLVAIIALLVPVAAMAQSAGSISGSVRDPDGYAIPGAAVTVTNDATNAQYTVTTSAQGGFRITSIAVGTYTVEVKLDGFRTSTTTGANVETGREYSLTISLEVGIVTEVVTVDAGGSDDINTSDSQITSTVGKDQIDALPLFDRNPLTLLAMQAGVASSPGKNTTVNGQRTSFTAINLDGVNIQDNFIRSNSTDFTPVRLTQSTVQEFSLTSQNGGSESGLGASQVAFTTPGGKNEWHGEGNWYHRNNKFAARDWFIARANGTISALEQNQAAFNIGGPLVKDKLFIWGNYELLRRLEETPSTAQLLLDPATNSPRDGFWTYNVTCTDPFGANNTVTVADDCPSAAITPGSTQVLDILGVFGLVTDPYIQANYIDPLPTTGNQAPTRAPLNTTGLSFNQRQNRNRDDFTVRLDYNATEQNQIGVTWKKREEPADRPDIDPTFNLVPANFTDSPMDFLATNWRYSPSATFTNEFRFGFALTGVVFDTNEDFDPRGILDDDFFLFTPAISEFQRQGRDTDTFNLSNNTTYVMGDHNMTFGFQTQTINVQSFSSFNVTPSWDNGLSTNAACAGTFCGGLVGSDFPGGITSSDRANANNLLTDLAAIISDGDAEFNVSSTTSGFVADRPSINNMAVQSMAFHFNDSWRFNPRLTVNLGLRWEFVGRFDETNGLFLSPLANSNDRAGALAGLLNPDNFIDFVGQGTGRSVYAKDMDNFGPNVGIAYDIFGDGKTSLRAGFAMHFVNDEIIRSADNAIGGNAGLNTTINTGSLNNVTFGGQAGTNPLPPIPAPPFLVPRQPIDNFLANNDTPQTVFTVDPQLEAPYVMSWNLGIQRDVGWNSVVEVRYNATRGVKLTRAVDYNQVDIFQTGYMASFQQARVNGFLQQAAFGNFDPRCQGDPLAPGADYSGVGCASLGWLDDPNNLVIGPLFSVGFIRDRVEEGEAGDLLATYHLNGLCGFTTGVNTGCAPNGLAGVADMMINYSTSDYHGGTVEFRRRMTDGLRFNVNYVWSKVLTDSGGEGQTNFDPFLDFGQQELERNRAGFDLTHQFKTNFTYELPAGEGHALSGNNAVNKLIGGWAISSFIMYQTGSPFSIVSNNRGTLNRRGRSNDRQGPDSNLTIDQIASNFGFFDQGAGGIFYIDPAVLEGSGRAVTPTTGLICAPSLLGFCNPSPGTVGNLRENSFNNPNFINWNLSLVKDTSITEEVGAQFRAEFFNFTNTPTFWLGNTEDVNSSSFGRFNSTLSTERKIQFGVRVTF